MTSKTASHNIFCISCVIGTVQSETYRDKSPW